ncbi:hypothetical protein EZV73_16020 [Acidaminobacter sp. JC074]|uniref:hypothetical protein n=1 Tax=Acidaminobacter sp. JC074 TaxID=2530199 RepID=UPI001F0DB95C|nr:hypothetical protein [Acidaminobacter sp. JC074]MCH4889103.1 hypothetical protein [Acidaminobacter sp. JC074]
MGRYNRSTGKYNHSTSRYTIRLPRYNQDPKYKPEIIIKPEKKINKKKLSSDFANLAEKLEVTPDNWNTSIELPEIEAFEELAEIEAFVTSKSDFEEITLDDSFQVEDITLKDSIQVHEQASDNELNDMFIENLISVENVPEKRYELPSKEEKKVHQEQIRPLNRSYQEETRVYDEETINHILEHDLDKIVTTEPKRRDFSPPKYDPTEDEFDLEKLKPFAGVIVFILFILFRGCS